MASKDSRGGKRVDGIPSKPRNQRISLDKAVDLTKRYRRAAPASEHGGFFWAAGITAILEQPGVTGLRFYHGLDRAGHYRLVLVGVDSSGRDVIKRVMSPASGGGKAAPAAARAATDDAVLIDGHYPCPPFCWPGSPLL